jgi:16S rRNA (cytosine1402-N4)-methyltransferase
MPTDGARKPPYHTPVLGEQVCALLLPPTGVSGGAAPRMVDLTVGGGGHASMLLAATAPGGRLLGLDRDPAALAAAAEALAPFGERAVLARGAFADAAEVAADHGFLPADAVLMDLGVSSHHLDDPARGFSFSREGPLDMRMDPDGPTTAADLVNELPVKELARIFREYGEERHATRVARAVVRARGRGPITTTTALADVVEAALPRPRGPVRIHPATRVFQALRMAVNDELGQLERGLDAAFDMLAPGGRLAVISFHSLEDRRVKRRFADLATGCICPPSFPECRCGRTPRARRLTRRVVRPDAAEVAANPRARSARLRAIERLSGAPQGPGARRAA